MKSFPHLPVHQYIDEITSALKNCRSAVIEAAPGAGKTMLVPPLLKEICPGGMTILVEPRRIAARAAAYGIAKMHQWTAGQETGFAVRGENCRCQKDGILAVTPGILLQMLQHDPTLEGIDALIFDEFHERSVEADLALSLALDIRDSLRDDLFLTVMSATMDSGRTGEFLQAPVIRIPGRSFPVEISCTDMPNQLRDLPANIARIILANIRHDDKDILVFLPGANEIRSCREILQDSLEDDFQIHSLHASLPLAEQNAALAPPPPGKRKLILATNVAESSLTIDNITTVIDSTWEKRAVWHPGAQMNFLEVRRITRASADQRAGRAGRTAPGRAVRCCSKNIYDNMTAEREPEILSADLAPLLLAVRCWGCSVSQLKWLDAPPEPAVKCALDLLKKLGLLDADEMPTAAGRRAATLPVSPRMAAMMISAPPGLRKTAAAIAALLEEKDDFLRFDSADISLRLEEFYRNKNRYQLQRGIAERLLNIFPPGDPGDEEDPGILIASAFPEWIARNRSAGGNVFQLSGGGAAALRENDQLRSAQFLAVARLDGSSGGNAAIRLALPVKQASLEKAFSGMISTQTSIIFDQNSGRPLAFSEKKLGALPLSRTPAAVPPEEIIPAIMKDAFKRNIPLPPPENKRACALMKRIRFAGNAVFPDIPENDQEFFLSLVPFFPENISTVSDLKKADWFKIIDDSMDFNVKSELNRICPEFFNAPTGMKFPIDYSGEQPTLAIQIQQLYGTKIHPVIGKNHIPLRVELLSPAMRPVQITCDIPGFWEGSWKLVRQEMRAKYPKHEWPEDPANAAPMRRSVKQKSS